MCADCEGDIPLTYYWDQPFNKAADRLNENIQRKFEADDGGGDGVDVGVGDGVGRGVDSGLDVGTGDGSGRGVDGGGAVYEPYARFASLFFYNSDNGYRHICHRLKYDGDIPEGRHYSRELGRRLASSRLFSDVDLVVPVPLHWTRRLKRGYNQADIIAREVAAVLGARHSANLLVRRRRTETQTVLSVEEKKRNVAGAFAVSRGALSRLLSGRVGVKELRPRHILIVDDVMTTGATISECHTALREVFPPGGVRISAATLACIENL